MIDWQWNPVVVNTYLSPTKVGVHGVRTDLYLTLVTELMRKPGGLPLATFFRERIWYTGCLVGPGLMVATSKSSNENNDELLCSIPDALTTFNFSDGHGDGCFSFCACVCMVPAWALLFLGIAATKFGLLWIVLHLMRYCIPPSHYMHILSHVSQSPIKVLAYMYESDEVSLSLSASITRWLSPPPLLSPTTCLRKFVFASLACFS